MKAPEKPVHKLSSGTEPPARDGVSSRFNAALYDANRSRDLAITVDVEKYRPFLEDSNLSEDEKLACLQAYWNVICEFVAMGFGIHPVQGSPESCEQTGSKDQMTGKACQNHGNLVGQFIAENHFDPSGDNRRETEEGASK